MERIEDERIENVRALLNPRYNIVPDPVFSELRPLLAERLAKVAALLDPDKFASLLDPLMRTLCTAVSLKRRARRYHLLLDRAGQALVPAYNTGPAAEKMVGKFRQPLNAGLICMVLASESAVRRE